MLVEAVRIQLIKYGLVEAESWSPEQIIEHVDKSLMEMSTKEPEKFPKMVEEFFARVKETMLTVNEVLQDDPPK